MVGQTVTTEGLVYASEFNGVWMQDLGCDEDPKTSDGIFVFARSGQPSLGDQVRVTGRVSEFFGSTQISRSSQSVLSSGNPLPVPTDIDPDSARAVALYYESLEHMRVRLVEGQTYVGTNRFGESFLVPGAIDQRVHRLDFAPEIFALDDSVSRPGVMTFAFDQVLDAVGPLAFSFNNYKLQVEDPSSVAVIGAGDRPHAITPEPSGTLGVATWNLFNVFDELDPDEELAVPAISLEEQAVKRAKIARALIDELGDPAVVAVQEVENLGLLEDIARETNLYRARQGSPGHYQAVLLEGNDPRGIDVGFLVDVTEVRLGNVRQLGKDQPSEVCQAGASEDLLYDRVPLAIEVTPHGTPTTYTVVSNHFKSKFGGTPENDFFEDCRVEQAEFLREAVDGLPSVLLVGDFNAFRDSPTLAVLTAGGYQNTVNGIPEDRRFSFVFEGKVQFLDHIVVSGDVTVAAVDSSKLDSDVPIPVFEDDPSIGWATSDHDPLVAYLGG
ncbi:MAG: endonuclease/exonuclease/phosphatase family protein [Acidimicrobiia bacterium]